MRITRRSGWATFSVSIARLAPRNLGFATSTSTGAIKVLAKRQSFPELQRRKGLTSVFAEQLTQPQDKRHIVVHNQGCGSRAWTGPHLARATR